MYNITAATNANLKPVTKKAYTAPAPLPISMTPSMNSNNEGSNIASVKIESLEKYIKDNFTIIKPEYNSNASPTLGLRISINPGKFKRFDGKLFDRVYSSEANLWYPDGDDYIMSELGIRNMNTRSKSRKTRKSHRSHKTRKTRRSHMSHRSRKSL